MLHRLVQVFVILALVPILEEASGTQQVIVVLSDINQVMVLLAGMA